jgi:biotin operon repressor/hypoxanthine-guanine phosphoribosyltransferase
MEIKTSDKIINYIEDKGQVSGNELANYLGITTRAVRKQLNNLLKESKVYKIGRPPKVFYSIKNEQEKADIEVLPKGLKTVIEDNFFIITPSGKRMEGLNGFIYWCQKQDLPVEKTAIEYEKTLKKYASHKKDGLIDGMYKIKKTFDEVYLDKIFYLDFYSIERFGKTKLGQLLLYAKQSQNKALISELVSMIKSDIERIIKKFNVNAVGFIPPTVKREVQLMKEIERQLNLSVPSISIVKLKTQVIVPQKTLNKLEDRIENAKNTIVVSEARMYDNLLLIDDALGSGSTLNEVAQKIKKQKIAKNIIGLAITGSYSGFEVISEV